MNNIELEIEITMKEFSDVSNAFQNVDVEKLPIELQIKTVTEYGNMLGAIKTFNNEIRKVVVAAAILGRTKWKKYKIY